MNNNYADYVIKDGVFIGEFEKMYQTCEDPWHQGEEASISYSRMDTITTINRFKFTNVLEVGCGLGFFTHLLAENCVNSKIVGMDISPTAIERAKACFSESNKETFICGNVKNIESVIEKVFPENDCSVLVFSEILWYILDDLDEIKQKLRECFKNRYIIINQVFYKNNLQKYGCEYFTTQEEMIEYFGFEVIVKNQTDILSNSTSYETHTVLKVV